MFKLYIDHSIMKEKVLKRNQVSNPGAENTNKTLLHIVFQQVDIAVLQKAMELDAALEGRVEIIRDDFAVGPIANLAEPEGWKQRRDWWKGLLDLSPYNSEDLMNMVDDKVTVHNLKRSLDEDEDLELWIWMGQNGHDVCGYYWLISELKDYYGRIKVLYLNNLPFINDKGQLFYPTTLHQIQPKEFLKAKKLNRLVTQSEMETDPDEWLRLCTENGMVRILEGGKKIVSKEASFFNDEILAGLNSEWQKGSKVMMNILGKMKIKTGDVYLLWQMLELLKKGKIEITGDPSKGWKEFEVRLKVTSPESAAIRHQP